MFRVRRLLAPFVLCIALLFSQAQAFTIAWLSDTQNYHNAYKPIFDGMTQWIADNRAALDIRFVFHTGDVVGSWSSEDQWRQARESMGILSSASIPFLTVCGNHDIGYRMNYANFLKYVLSLRPASMSQEYGDIGSVDAAGLFESDYGCGVDMLVCWLLTGGESGDLTFTADIYLVSYEMRSTAHYGDCRLVINGETHYFSAPEVDVEATKTTVTTLLSTETVTVPRNSDGTASLDVTVVYPFRGTYNSVSLPVIEAATVITVSADGSVDFR